MSDVFSSSSGSGNDKGDVELSFVVSNYPKEEEVITPIDLSQPSSSSFTTTTTTTTATNLSSSATKFLPQSISKSFGWAFQTDDLDDEGEEQRPLLCVFLLF